VGLAPAVSTRHTASTRSGCPTSAICGGVCQPHRLRCAIQHLLRILWAGLLRNRLKRG